MTQYYVVAIFNLYGKIKNGTFRQKTINNDEVKKSAGVFKLGRGFMMGVVKPRGGSEHHFFDNCYLFRRDLWKIMTDFSFFFEQFNFS